MFTACITKMSLLDGFFTKELCLVVPKFYHFKSMTLFENAKI